MRRALLLAIPLAFSSAACDYDNGDAHRVFRGQGAAGNGGAGSGSGGQPSSAGGLGNSGGYPSADCPSPSTPVQSTIDADRQIEVDAGQGAGVFVEYQTGGHWLLRTSCDTAKSAMPCKWDVIVTPEDKRSISNVVAADLEPGDSVIAYPGDDVSYQLLATTGSDIDGFSFDSDPGAGIRVDAYLDDQCALAFFFWVGDGALHSGSPTNPVDLIPSAP